MGRFGTPFEHSFSESGEVVEDRYSGQAQFSFSLLRNIA